MKEIDKLRPLLFKLSLIISVVTVLLALNFSTARKPRPVHAILTDRDREVDIVRTMHKVPGREVPSAVGHTEPEVTDIEPLDLIAYVETATEPRSLDSILNRVFPEQAVAGESDPPAVLPPEETDEPILVPDKIPVFGECRMENDELRKRCSDKNVLEYMADNVKYPAEARESDIEGLVVIEFVIGKDGKVRDMRVVKDIGGGCGEEALRVVSGMQAWSPGIRNNQPVSVIYRLPVRFRLE